MTYLNRVVALLVKLIEIGSFEYKLSFFYIEYTIWCIFSLIIDLQKTNTIIYILFIMY